MAKKTDSGQPNILPFELMEESAKLENQTELGWEPHSALGGLGRASIDKKNSWQPCQSSLIPTIGPWLMFCILGLLHSIFKVPRKQCPCLGYALTLDQQSKDCPQWVRKGSFQRYKGPVTKGAGWTSTEELGLVRNQGHTSKHTEVPWFSLMHSNNVWKVWNLNFTQCLIQ